MLLTKISEYASKSYLRSYTKRMCSSTGLTKWASTASEHLPTHGSPSSKRIRSSSSSLLTIAMPYALLLRMANSMPRSERRRTLLRPSSSSSKNLNGKSYDTYVRLQMMRSCREPYSDEIQSSSLTMRLFIRKRKSKTTVTSEVCWQSRCHHTLHGSIPLRPSSHLLSESLLRKWVQQRKFSNVSLFVPTVIECL